MVTFWQLLRYNQRVLVYPSGFEDRPRFVHAPSSFGMAYEDVELTTNDKVKLRCYLVYSSDGKENARGTVILFHGNAMNHGDSLSYAHRLSSQKFNVLTVEYRGYGHSEGVPSETGLVVDAQTALDYVTRDPVLSLKPIVIYGQSLGGAVAIDVTSRNAPKISALIIENTFTSIPDIVKALPVPVLPHIAFLCTQRWDSAAKMARIPPSLPVLMLSGQMDTVVPPAHMQGLWEVAKERGKPRRKKGENVEYVPPQRDVFEAFPSGMHNTTSEARGYWDKVADFVNDNVPVSGPDRVVDG